MYYDLRIPHTIGEKYDWLQEHPEAAKHFEIAVRLNSKGYDIYYIKRVGTVKFTTANDEQIEAKTLFKKIFDIFFWSTWCREMNKQITDELNKYVGVLDDGEDL